MIRRIRERDIQTVSALIQNTLIVSNSPDYDLETIGNLHNAFSAEQLRRLASRRRIYVYEVGGAVLGTIGLEGDKVCNFFVPPDRQGSGVGSQLLEFVERKARSEGMDRLLIDSSLTAASFYRAKGYRETGQQVDNAFGKTVTMEKKLRGL